MKIIILSFLCILVSACEHLTTQSQVLQFSPNIPASLRASINTLDAQTRDGLMPATLSVTSSMGVIASFADGAPAILVCPDVTDCSADMVVAVLYSKMVQQRLRAMATKDVSLNFRPLPPSAQTQACFGAEFTASEGLQRIPLCWSSEENTFQSFFYDVVVNNTTPQNLSLWGFYMSSEGCVQSLGSWEQAIQAGQSFVTYRGGSSLPVNKKEGFIVLAAAPNSFAVPEFNSCEANGLEQLREFVAQLDGHQGEYFVAMRDMQTVVNRALGTSEAGVVPGQPREYTINDFDIRPYLPDDRGSSLYKVLYTAHQLSISAQTGDGIGYKQHPWDKADDAANLDEGIDCSRAIWFSFTRSGLFYTAKQLDANDMVEDQTYIPTISMVSNNSLLAHHFERCDDVPPQLGDVLVYRRSDKNAGHVVMVIDPEQRIAWGSHGWDGNGLTPGVVPDVGAEYQLIKRKPDWQAWDRSTMELKACWRYQDFIDISKVDIGNSALVSCDITLANCKPDI